MEQITVLATGLRFPESPVFDLTGRLWCSEQEGAGLFCRYEDGRTEKIVTGGRPGGLTVDKQGGLWFCDSGKNTIRHFDPEVRQIETVVDSYGGKPLNRPANLLFDRMNNLIFTCPGPPLQEVGISGTQGEVLVLTSSGSIQIVADELSYPTGLAFLPSTDSLLIAKTQKQRLWCGFWDMVTLSWETIDVWANTGKVINNAHGPHGLAVGPDNAIYTAVFGVGVVRVFDPDGQLIRGIPLPGRRPTSCVVDPSGQFLVVAETERGELLQVRI